jgi:exopolyphosphatase/pppGpp-phosphohydrolase
VKLAAIDVGTNSIHRIVVDTAGERAFEIVDQSSVITAAPLKLPARRSSSPRASSPSE